MRAILVFILLLPIFLFAQHKHSVAPKFALGSFTDDYGITYQINDSLWVQNSTMKFHIIK